MKRFSTPQKWIAGLDKETASTLITVSSDIALVVNDAADQGQICDIAFGSDELARDFQGAQLLGQPWIETVSADSRPKVEALLRDALSNAAPRWRHVNHLSAEGKDLPVMYSAVKVGPRDRVVAMGRSLGPLAAMQQRLLEAQRSMEREYARLRQIETRHRLLFQVASEAIVIVDAGTRKIVEANPAATHLLGDAGRRLLGHSVLEAFDSKSRRALEGLFARVASLGHADEYPVRALSDSAQGTQDIRVSASMFREGRSSYLLLRLLPGSVNPEGVSEQRQKSRVMDLVASSPDGFVVTDMKGVVLFANRAFLELVQMATEEQVYGESLDRWLGSPGVDFSLLTHRLGENQSLRLFLTTLRGEYGSLTEVEICAVVVPESDEPCCGFTIRDISSRLPVHRREGIERPRSVEQLTELVGRVPLKELVRESTDMIERLCIEAALELTGDNRASAAEILGLSRQSLYAKLNRHGLAESEGARGPEDSGKA